MFWTLQSKKVIEIARKDGIYYPDFSLSATRNQKDYMRILTAFNELNGTAYKGLVFCFAPDLLLSFQDWFNSKEEVVNLLRGNLCISDTLADDPFFLFDKDHVLVKIEEPEFNHINTVPIDYWNYLAVMDGGAPDFFYAFTDNPDYTSMDYEEFEEYVLESIRHGGYAASMTKATPQSPYKTVTELHIPYIKYSAITETYEASELL